FHARLAGRLERERRRQELPHLRVKMRFHLAGVGLTVPFVQLGLGIEQVHLAGTAVLKKANHGLARGRWCGFFGARSPSARARSVASRWVSARLPRLPAYRARKARRVKEKGSMCTLRGYWIYKNALLARII